MPTTGNAPPTSNCGTVDRGHDRTDVHQGRHPRGRLRRLLTPTRPTLRHGPDTTDPSATPQPEPSPPPPPRTSARLTKSACPPLVRVTVCKTTMPNRRLPTLEWRCRDHTEQRLRGFRGGRRCRTDRAVARRDRMATLGYTVIVRERHSLPAREASTDVLGDLGHEPCPDDEAGSRVRLPPRCPSPNIAARSPAPDCPFGQPPSLSR